MGASYRLAPGSRCGPHQVTDNRSCADNRHGSWSASFQEADKLNQPVQSPGGLPCATGRPRSYIYPNKYSESLHCDYLRTSRPHESAIELD
ncbi:unnamed protein product [Protopolystoma xenopodis]|uniref:CUB domain-containing protein n=1 Tax=Protopolystoma xenopodis TaxID=117903 RepID=A0A3S5BMI6_9PLAT|nr:unnamed protein product [Protopolystoma xenopodis]